MLAFLAVVIWNVHTNNVVIEIDSKLDELTTLRGETFAASLAAQQFGAAVENQIPDTAQLARTRLVGLQTTINDRVIKVIEFAPELTDKLAEIAEQTKAILELPQNPGEGIPDEAGLLSDLSTELAPQLENEMLLVENAADLSIIKREMH